VLAVTEEQEPFVGIVGNAIAFAHASLDGGGGSTFRQILKFEETAALHVYALNKYVAPPVRPVKEPDSASKQPKDVPGQLPLYNCNTRSVLPLMSVLE
jgi:hypothetical protein